MPYPDRAWIHFPQDTLLISSVGYAHVPDCCTHHTGANVSSQAADGGGCPTSTRPGGCASQRPARYRSLKATPPARQPSGAPTAPGTCRTEHMPNQSASPTPRGQWIKLAIARVDCPEPGCEMPRGT